MSIIKSTGNELVKLDSNILTVKNIFETSSTALTEDEAIILVNCLIKEFGIDEGELSWVD